MDENKTLILQKTREFLAEYKGLETKKRRLVQKFMEEIHELGEQKTFEDIDKMLKDI